MPERHEFALHREMNANCIGATFTSTSIDEAQRVPTTEQWAICPSERAALLKVTKAKGIHVTSIATDLTQDYIYFTRLRKQVRDGKMNLIIELPPENVDGHASQTTETLSRLMACADGGKVVFAVAPRYRYWAQWPGLFDNTTLGPLWITTQQNLRRIQSAHGHDP